MPYKKPIAEWISEAYKSIQEFVLSSTNFFAGLAGAALGYFQPTADVVHMIVAFFIIDMIFGYLKDAIKNKAKFKIDLLFTKVLPRMILSVLIIEMLFVWDTASGQDFYSSYKIIGYFIGGALLWSVATNIFYITKWTVFLNISNIINKKVEETTGEKIDRNAEEAIENMRNAKDNIKTMQEGIDKLKEDN